jgi:hypothetical protein
MKKLLKQQIEAAPKPIEQTPDERLVAMQVIKNGAKFDSEYRYDDRFRPGNPTDFASVHTVAEMMAHLSQPGCKTEIDARVIEVNRHGGYRYRRIKDVEKFKETWKKNARVKKMREAKHKEWGGDAFATDGTGGAGANSGMTGDDYVPLLGGPFNKQPYLYDYLRAHAYCFHEYHHHPFARAIVHITRDFVLGRGYRIDSDDPRALALWRAFEEVNNLQAMMELVVSEGSIYGENMIWWLPNNDVNIAYNPGPGQEPGKGIIPRIRMIDPSTVWEIITFPEDITRVLAYVQVFPTQYQIYTGTSGGSPVPTAKFVMQHIPAEEVMHFKYNCVSNEKRGRSDLFPILGYLKWIRDVVNYKLIACKKQSAWTEDISVEGSQADVNQLTNDLQNLGEFEPAGSRFIHTSKITRQYLANAMGQSGKDETLEWGVDMIAVGSQIPASYFGLLNSAGATRASALVGTEPVAKKFEQKQKEGARLLTMMWRRFQDNYGIPGAKCEVTFPEVISQDSDSKIKTLKFVEDCEYISHQTAAQKAAKEIDMDSYNYEEEMAQIKSEQAMHTDRTLITPLTSPQPPGSGAESSEPEQPGSEAPASPAPDGKTNKPSAVTGDQKRSLRLGMGA